MLHTNTNKKRETVILLGKGEPALVYSCCLNSETHLILTRGPSRFGCDPWSCNLARASLMLTTNHHQIGGNGRPKAFLYLCVYVIPPNMHVQIIVPYLSHALCLLH